MYRPTWSYLSGCRAINSKLCDVFGLLHYCIISQPLYCQWTQPPTRELTQRTNKRSINVHCQAVGRWRCCASGPLSHTRIPSKYKLIPVDIPIPGEYKHSCSRFPRSMTDLHDNFFLFAEGLVDVLWTPNNSIMSLCIKSSGSLSTRVKEL